MYHIYVQWGKQVRGTVYPRTGHEGTGGG